ncbi:MAG: hypothetical protein EB075_12095, partial [Bacteroidetes bacterium]|nr:hypothetical protein [Bacteroidota bacterium]
MSAHIVVGVAGGIAAEESHVYRVVRHIGVRDTAVRIQHMVHVVVVDQHGTFGAQQFDAVGLAQRRVFGGQGVAHAEVDHCTVGAIEAAVLGARDAETDSVVRFAKVIEYPINPGYADCFIDDGTGTVGINDRRNVTNENVTDYSGNTSSG